MEPLFVHTDWVIPRDKVETKRVGTRIYTSQLKVGPIVKVLVNGPNSTLLLLIQAILSG